MSDQDEMVAFRLAPRDRAAIQRLVDAGVFQNRSDFLRYAVKATLAEHARELRPTLDLDLEGVDLPAQAAPKSTRARASQRKEVKF